MCNGRGCCKPDLGLLPMFTGITMAAGILTTYTIAVALGHVSPLLPSISDTGIKSPEMHIFSQVLNIVAVLSLVTFILRYKMIHAMLDEDDLKRLRTWTRINLFVGCIASFGLSIVGNFQDNTAFGVHMTGAFMVFLFGNCYCITDAVIVQKTHPYDNRIFLFRVRLALGIFGFTAFFIAWIAFVIAHRDADEKGQKFSRPHWSKQNSDNTSAIAHLVGAFMVFLLGNCYIILDSSVTNSMCPKYNGRPIFAVRLLLGVVGLTAFTITVIGAAIANRNSIFSTKDQRLHWGPDDPGYAAHLVSTFGEWIMGLAFVCYFFTYIKDFSKFGADIKIDMKVDHLDQVPLYHGEISAGLRRTSDPEQNQNEPDETTGLLKKS